MPPSPQTSPFRIMLAFFLALMVRQAFFSHFFCEVRLRCKCFCAFTVNAERTYVSSLSPVACLGSLTGARQSLPVL